MTTRRCPLMLNFARCVVYTDTILLYSGWQNCNKTELEASPGAYMLPIFMRACGGKYVYLLYEYTAAVVVEVVASEYAIFSFACIMGLVTYQYVRVTLR